MHDLRTNFLKLDFKSNVWEISEALISFC